MALALRDAVSNGAMKRCEVELFFPCGRRADHAVGRSQRAGQFGGGHQLAVARRAAQFHSGIASPRQPRRNNCTARRAGAGPALRRFRSVMGAVDAAILMRWPNSDDNSAVEIEAAGNAGAGRWRQPCKPVAASPRAQYNSTMGRRCCDAGISVDRGNHPLPVNLRLRRAARTFQPALHSSCGMWLASGTNRRRYPSAARRLSAYALRTQARFGFGHDPAHSRRR